MLLQEVNRHLQNIDKIDYGLIIMKQSEADTFAYYFEKALSSDLSKLEKTFSSLHTVSIVRDFWLVLYKGREKLVYNDEMAMIHPIRNILLQDVMADQHFKKLETVTYQDACKSLICAIIVTQFVLAWTQDTLRKDGEAHDNFIRVSNIHVDEFQRHLAERSHDLTPLPRDILLAQTSVVKLLRSEYTHNPHEFSSVLFQAYNGINYIGIESIFEDNQQEVLAGLREVLKAFYDKRYKVEQ